jgi:SAM-dependent methyltransferase
METVPCLLCGSERYKKLFSAYDFLIRDGSSFELVRCSRCGFVFLDPRPSRDEILRFYPPHFYRFLSPELENQSKELQSRRARMISRIKGKGRILDVGSCKGDFLYEMKTKGWETWGIEISSDGCSFAKERFGLTNIINKDLNQTDLPENYFDVITLWHVIEHLHDPLATIAKISRVLKDDGLLVLECPNFDSLTRKLFNRYWFALDLPRHLYQFTPGSLQRLLNSHGLVVKKYYFPLWPKQNITAFKVSLAFFLERKPDPSRTQASAAVPIKKNLLWPAARAVLDGLFYLMSLCAIAVGKGDYMILFAKKEK